MSTRLIMVDDKMYTMIDRQGFRDWLLAELEKREWSQTYLADRIGLTRQAISNMINRGTIPNHETCLDIAEAFHIDPQEVYRRAGLLPPKSPHEEHIERIYYKLSKLEDDDRKQVEEYIEFMLQRNEGAGKKSDEDRHGGFGEVN